MVLAPSHRRRRGRWRRHPVARASGWWLVWRPRRRWQARRSIWCTSWQRSFRQSTGNERPRGANRVPGNRLRLVRWECAAAPRGTQARTAIARKWFAGDKNRYTFPNTCLLYTSDAADEEDSVDLGGRRIIKKK